MDDYKPVVVDGVPRCSRECKHHVRNGCKIMDLRAVCSGVDICEPAILARIAELEAERDEARAQVQRQGYRLDNAAELIEELGKWAPPYKDGTGGEDCPYVDLERCDLVRVVQRKRRWMKAIEY